MPLRPATEVADRLSRLHAEEFAGTRQKQILRVSPEAFYLISGRKQLRASKYREIAAALLRQHQLILGRANDYFLLLPASIAARDWPLLPLTAARREVRRKPPALAAPPLPEAPIVRAVWPFPNQA